MWGHLRSSKLGFKFKREQPIGRFRLDFYCREALLCVEMDGEQHDGARDAIRDKALAKLGILTYRVPNRRFFQMDEAPFKDDIREIQELCEQRAGRSSGACREAPHPLPPLPRR